jgi:two-component system response regulator AtoC
MVETLLIIEDEKLLGFELSLHYKTRGWEVFLANSLAEAKNLLFKKRIEPLLILSDMNLPDGNALDFMETVKKQIPMPEWLFLTGYGSVPDSVRALRLGAYDFLEKPCDLERLDLVVTSAARSATTQRRVIEQVKQEHKRYAPEAYVGQSQQAQNIRQLLTKLTQ